MKTGGELRGAGAGPAEADDSLRTIAGDGAEERLPAPMQVRDPGRYQIIGEHGRGGLGRVFRAHDRELGRDVALKELLLNGRGTEPRFFREALITARLEHPGIVPVHEAGRWPDGTPFYAMKLVSGRPLKALLDATTSLEARLALIPNVIAVADAIAYAHDRKIIHRDLKPSNIIVGDFGETVVIDWGLAKDLQSSADEALDEGVPRPTPSEGALTAIGSVLGTPAYMAPEQAQAGAVDARTDVYAIGAILFQLCTGSAPPQAPRPEAIAAALRKLDPDLAVIVSKALAIDPDRRYPHAGALAADLKAFESGARIAARRYSVAGMLAHWIRRHRRLAIAIATLVALAAVGATLSISEIVAQRDRAGAALAGVEKARATAEQERVTAEQERDRARQSEALMLLAKDPTGAWALVGNAVPRTPAEALLKARILGAGVAEHTVSPSYYRIERVARLGVDGWLAVATIDRALYLVEVATGTVRLLDRGLTEPPLLHARAGTLTYEKVDGGGPQIVVTHPLVAGDRPIRITAPGPVASLFAVGEAVYVLTKHGELFVAPSAGVPFQRVRAGVHVAAPLADHDLLLCLESGRLVASSHGTGVDRGLGRCDDHDLARAIATAGASYAVTGDDATLRFGRPAGAGSVPFVAAGAPIVAITSAGLIAAIDGSGIPWLLGPAATQLARGPRTSARATAVTASGELVAWGFSDGSIQVRDTDSRQAWSLRGHQQEISQLRVDPVARTLTSFGGNEIRSWRLTGAAPVVVAELDTQVFNAELDREAGLAVLDSEGGGVRLARRGRAGLELLHTHRALAFATTWHAGRACSAGWDGQVLCTDPATGRTTVEGSHAQPVRWLVSRGGRLVYAVADGSVWEAGPEARELYRHGAETYRVNLDDEGRRVASSAHDGSVFVHDRATGTLVRRVDAHEGMATNIFWSGGRLRTAGIDGVVKVWTPTLELIASFDAGGPILDHRARGVGHVTAAGPSLILTSPDEAREDTFDLGARMSAVGVSVDGVYVATANRTGDIVVHDTRRRRVASVSLGPGYIPTIEFWDANTALVCGPSGLVVTIAMDQLTFVDWDPPANQGHR